MGNHLAGLAPSQIFPVEHYLTESNDFHFDISLGSTRFLKVARARSASGHVVVKVFTIHDPSLDLRIHLEKLLEIRKRLEGCLNCLPFQKVWLTDRAGFLVRQYVKQSLYDRMSTRPFLTLIEKKWIAFQLLLALQQAHKHGFCHGDVKIENVMVTSWNWVFLTDFASFKPTFLPEDNPADFSFYFDTSRKRTCYIAPERFKARQSTSELNLARAVSPSPSSPAHNINSQSEPNMTSLEVGVEAGKKLFLPDEGGAGAILGSGGDLLHTMDIFSVGCVIIELFTDTSPFYFSDLLTYRAGEFYPDKVLSKIEDPDVRAMLEHMIHKDPSKRNSANEYLSQEKGRVFPNYFYSFLQSYMQIFSSDNAMMPDEKVERIHENINKILGMLSHDQFDGSGLGLIVTLITSNMRSLKFQTAKISALKCLSLISPHVPHDTILDRMLPDVIVCLSDSFPLVRIAAINCLLDCLKSVHFVPLSDVNIFPEYLLPQIIPLCHDRNENIRAALAQCISKVANEAKRFLNLSVAKLKSSNENSLLTYDLELMALHDSIAQMVTVLLSDNVNSVKQALMEHSVTQLAIFFGRMKANDILLSHMITFLNDREDPQLRCCFYENIVGLASFIGWQCTQILMPLLQQGLSDSQETVIVHCIETTTNLINLGLIRKYVLYEFLKESVPFILHPNLWIRLSVTDLVVASAKFLDEVDVMVKLSSILKPFLTNNIAQFDKDWIIMANVCTYIPRIIYEILVKFDGLPDLFSVLEERQTKRNKVIKNVNSLSGSSGQDVDQNIRHILKRLVSEGMSANMEDKLLLMEDILIKISRHQHSTKKASKDRHTGRDFSLNVTSLASETEMVIKREDLNRTKEEEKCTTSTSSHISERPIIVHQAINAPSVNEEWQHMFGSSNCNNGDKKPLLPRNSFSSLSLSSSSTATEANQNVPEEAKIALEVNPSSPTILSELENEKKMKSFGQNAARKQFYYSHCAPCKNSLESLLKKKRGDYQLNARKKSQLGYQLSDKHMPHAGWRPKGQLRAHMHEHDGAIVKLIRLKEKPIFASAATDGCVRLWDCQKMEGSNIVNKAYKIFSNHDGSPLTSVAICSNPYWMASSAENGIICVNSIETSSILHKRTIDVDDKGPANDLYFQETGSSPLLVYGTAFGDIVGWDFRIPSHKDAFRLSNGLKNGIQTALAISDDQAWAISGTSSGTLSCWDLRFQLPIVTCTHPSDSRIRELVVQPGGSSCVWASVQGNNEVGLWNMESQCRQVVLWASAQPLLSNAQPSTQSVTALQSIVTSGLNAVITAGTDMRIRFWDIADKSKSFIVAGAGCENINPKSIGYRTKLVDGVEVVQECHTYTKENRQANNSAAGAIGGNPVSNHQSSDLNGGELGPEAQNSLNKNGNIQVENHFVNKPGIEPPPSGHHDWISGLTICQGSSSNWYLVTGSRDGVIKVWF